MSQEDTPPEGQEPEAAPTNDEPKAEKPDSFSREYVEKLRAEAASNRKAAQEAAAKVEEYESANQTELEKLTGKLSKAEESRKAAETKLLRFEVAAEKEVPPQAVDFLVGDNREELEAKADKLLQLVKDKETTPDFDGGARDPAPEPKSPEQSHDEDVLRLLGLTT